MKITEIIASAETKHPKAFWFGLGAAVGALGTLIVGLII
jgi:hypothetical protein